MTLNQRQINKILSKHNDVLVQTIIIIIIVVVIIIIILIIILIVWFGPMCFFFSIHRRKGSYLAYLIN